MKSKKDLIYQVTIAILLIAVAFAFYKLYRGPEVPKYENRLVDTGKSLDIKTKKVSYELLDLKYSSNILDRQKLNEKLLKLATNSKKSLRMVERYNEENPDNQIEIDDNLDSSYLPESSDSSLDIGSRYGQNSERVESFINGHTSSTSLPKDSTTAKKSSSSTGIANNIGGGTSSVSDSSSYNSVSVGSLIASTANDTATRNDNDSTLYTSVDGDIEKYTSSISEIQSIMNRISSNLE